jgi:hypothetical protein
MNHLWYFDNLILSFSIKNVWKRFKTKQNKLLIDLKNLDEKKSPTKRLSFFQVVVNSKIKSKMFIG